ncbi:MAG: mitochondrial fission ELM1 family protein [Pseudomonadota bacterium]
MSGALGLAEAVGLPITNKHVSSRRPWRWLPPALWPTSVLGVGPEGDALEPPWPSLLISAGERAVGPALAIRRRSAGETFCVHIQHPRVNPKRFDLVTASAHDQLTGPNVRTTLGALHRVTHAAIEAGAAQLWDAVAHLPRPRIGVLVGGANRSYRFDPETAARFATRLVDAATETGGSLLISASRRTGAASEALLRTRLAAVPSTFWDGTGNNPYLGYLGLADAFVVTSDSVNMTTEACLTGKPVHVFKLPGKRRTKFETFHEQLVAEGYTRPFEGRIESWHYEGLDERTALAHEIIGRLRSDT